MDCAGNRPQGETCGFETNDFFEFLHGNPFFWASRLRGNPEGYATKVPSTAAPDNGALNIIPIDREHHSGNPDKVFTITPERCSRCSGISVHDQTERVFTMAGNTQFSK